jgi:molybdopterin-containing oxidoreductase family iron-sulfur binding subunit
MSTNGEHKVTRPACGEDPGELVQIGLRTGSRSTGFEATRRDVLSLLGFSIGAAGMAAGCRAPTQKALPLPIASDQMVAGVANVYATTCGGCASACSLLVKQRDGRPIKIEGNDASPLFGGGTCATGQATVLSLYDEARLRGPLMGAKPAAWAAVDGRITTALEGARGDSRDVILLSRTHTSPSARALLETIRAKHPRFRQVVYDPMSASAIRAANAKSFGVAVVPHYRFDLARVIVALDADFLGTWLSPVQFARQYAPGRTKDSTRSFHVQVESEMSVSGSNADLRVALAPSEIGSFATALLGAVGRGAGDGALKSEAGALAAAAPQAQSQKIERIAARLLAHKGQSLVVSGSEDPAVQTVVNALNATLGNVGKTVDLARPSLQRQGDDGALPALVDDMAKGKVAALLIWDANPVYDHPQGKAFADALAKVPLTVSLSDRVDETAAHVQLVCPDHHFLEAWGDAEPIVGHLSLAQPLIAPLFDTRAAVESLVRWFRITDAPADAHEQLRAFWRTTLFPRQKAIATFEDFWDKTLEHGVVELPPDAPPAGLTPFRGDWKTAAATISSAAQQAREPGAAGAGARYEVHLHETVGVREGRETNNPWLLELPDPFTRLTWGNVARIAPVTATALGLATGDVVSLATAAGTLEAPVFVQAGQHPQTISLAVGYGRTAAGKAGNGVGVNAYPLMPIVGGVRRVSAIATVGKVDRRVRLAPAQTHFSMEGRPIVQETGLDSAPAEGAEEREVLPNLWKERLHGEHSWGMSIDLDACTGCSACVVACQAENNVPVVGPTQIYKTRIMHWMRIDRYVDGNDEDATMVHQPMLCQHCQHAPCETVCPVLATTTSSEGINQQVYNRCIGTRYCANNCPYKVRRFNWHNYTSNEEFAYNMTSPLGRLVLNPDVTVRSRGVMEKCSLCVQRVQLAKNQALQERRPMADGDVQTACQQSCPTGAIVFGDLKDPESRVSKLLEGRRAYRLLEELGTRPNVGYLKRVKRSELV